MPLVSIVIPCYQGRRFLAEAIESCLRQTHRDLEVIVVDDASPTNDFEIAERYASRDSRVRVYRHEANGGVSRALNSGFGHARGEYFSRLAQDDLFREDAIRTMLDCIESEPACGLVYCDMQLIDEHGTLIGMLEKEGPERAVLPCNRVGLCVLWRRDVWREIGPFDPRFDAAEDYEFFLRLSRRSALRKCRDQAPFFFRYHPDQGSRRFERRQQYAAVMAQFSHYWALALEEPRRLRYWRHVATGMVHLAYRRAKLLQASPG